MRETLKEKSETLQGLNKEQIKAVTHGAGPLLIIAGAGTGKTTVLTRRIAWLTEQGLAKPEEILALTFTEKAATEMEERVDQLMPLGYVEIDISTFHAFGQKILQDHALDIGLPGDFKVLTETQAFILLRKHIHEMDLDYYRPIGNPDKFIHSLLKHFSKAKGEEITPAEYLEYADSLRLNTDSADIEEGQELIRVKEVANAYHYYQKLLLDNSYFDFGDLINYSLQLLRSRPKVLVQLQQKYKYILVDEFQDTDLSQYELVKLIAKSENNITVVGDDDQSIYKFRGASISNILKFKEDFPKTEEVTLIKNFRSSQNILNLAYDFIQLNNPERLESRLKISKKLQSTKSETGVIEVLHAPTVYDEACLVVDKIIELTRELNFSFNDFAILARANDHAEPFISELAKRGISYIFVANRGLYKKPIILDILAYLNLLDNYHENENLFRILNLSKFKINEHDLITISQTAKRKTASIYEVLKNQHIVSITAESRKKIAELLAFIDRHCYMASSKPVTEVLVTILSDLGIIRTLATDSLENVEDRSNIEQFYKKAQSFESDTTDKTTKGFLSQIKLEQEAGDQGQLSFNPDLGPDAVRIMTAHAAKGLEFACVFVINMVEQRFPSRDRKDQIEIPPPLVREILPEGDAHLMEERRLFYVAVTRAKTHLYLTMADDYGGVAHKKPSRFLLETNLVHMPKTSAPSGQVFFSKQQALPIATEIKFTVPDTFSFSQINCFKNCPLEYKLRYVYGLPIAGQAQLTFGDTIHKTLEKFLKRYQQINNVTQKDLFGNKKAGLALPEKELLYKLYEETWSDDWFADKIQKASYYKSGFKMLDNFFERMLANLKTVKYLEHRFKLKLGNHKFVGKIDRADLNADGSLDIVDYKTGQSKQKLGNDDKAQLLVYQWAAEEEFKQKINSLTYWYLDSLRDYVSFIGTKSEIEEVKEKMLVTIDEIITATKHNSFAQLDLRKSHECKYKDLVK